MARRFTASLRPVLFRILTPQSGFVAPATGRIPHSSCSIHSTSSAHFSTSSTHFFTQSEAPSVLKGWKLGRLNHVAIAVPDLERASKLYRDVLGAEVSDVMPLPEHGVSTVFVSLGNTKIELLHPLGEKSPIESFLQKKPSGGMHHICIEVDDIKKAIKDLEGKIRPLNPEPQIGAHGKPVVFLHPKDCDGVLIELEEA